MKDSEFIELLNLYLDHEISAADSARLEAEVQTNPARRRVYQQYCRMQKACKLVAADFETTADRPEVAPPTKVVAFDPDALAPAAARRRRVNNFYTVGTLVAAAACVAIVFIGRNRQAATAELSTAAAPTVAQVAAPATPTISLSTANPAGNSGALKVLVAAPGRASTRLVADPLFLTGSSRAEAVYAAAVQQANDQLAWLEGVQLSPLQTRQVGADDLQFVSTLRPEGRALGQRPSNAARSAQAEEMVTFQFMK
ncbi:anti-sigma factor family protein [Horticoccus sp. 23ND18S-11]|uniref:anti-sigma factor family protein n=1 Tax=Horticoccus sp. 23ND18S-11 TaxID=3391832 RepID=UPI0039C9E9C7